MELENNFGRMDQNILENGERAKHMARESSFTQTETITREIGVTIKLADMVYTSMKMEISMRASGKTMCSMAMERSDGQTDLVIKVHTTKERNMALDFISGQMDRSTTATGITMS